METLSAAWEDLGYSQKGARPEKALFRIPPSPIPNHQHEPDELREPRKERNLKAIRSIVPDAKEDSMGVVLVKIRGYTYAFHPKTDTYVEEWRDKYGKGIEDLCRRLYARLCAT